MSKSEMLYLFKTLNYSNITYVHLAITMILFWTLRVVIDVQLVKLFNCRLLKPVTPVLTNIIL